MQYLVERRGGGYGFRMRTPDKLVGATDPHTGRPFGKEITRGLGTRRLSEAKKARDILLGKVRELEAGISGDDRYSLERAESWAAEIAREDAGYVAPYNQDVEPEAQLTVRELVHEQIERAESLPPSRRPDREALRRFGQVALGTGYLLDRAVERYLEERRPGNVQGYKPLALTSVNALRSAVNYLKVFLEEQRESPFLQVVDRKRVERFRYDFLPKQQPPRAPDGLSVKTVARHATMLSGLWDWAIERSVLRESDGNPWKSTGHRVPRTRKPTGTERVLFSPEQASAILLEYPVGDRLGDIFRLALVTGCRADELASLTSSDLMENAAGFSVSEGKTVNARRFIPVIGIARPLLLTRLEAARSGNGNIFPEWPERLSTGKRSALPQAFTRARRKVLGEETDNKLALHSTRHTWRTMARRARIPEPTVNDLGGWTGQKTSNSVYDHHLRRELIEAQEKIGAMLKQEGYLRAW